MVLISFCGTNATVRVRINLLAVHFVQDINCLLCTNGYIATPGRQQDTGPLAHTPSHNLKHRLTTLHSSPQHRLQTFHRTPALALRQHDGPPLRHNRHRHDNSTTLHLHLVHIHTHQLLNLSRRAGTHHILHSDTRIDQRQSASVDSRAEPTTIVFEDVQRKLNLGSGVEVEQHRSPQRFLKEVGLLQQPSVRVGIQSPSVRGGGRVWSHAERYLQ
mmetsp:Transcript_33631/g.33896  ORF Transcript_33631/g.33896 Transcript_33631/m.33896 type:complete len:216 (-) Transcript_33631:306-953(-)